MEALPATPFILIHDPVSSCQNDGTLSWEFVRAAIAEGKVSRLVRTPEQTAIYEAFRVETAARYASTFDRVIERVFGYPALPTAGCGKLAVQIPEPRGTRLVLRPNDFPYNLASGLRHDVLWSEGGPLDEVAIAAYIALNFAGHETLHFVNPPALQSVPTIFHVHIISRPQR